MLTPELLLAVASAAALGEGELTVTPRHVAEAAETLRRAMGDPGLRELARELAEELAEDWPEASEAYTDKECMARLGITDPRTWENLLKRVEFPAEFDPKTMLIPWEVFAYLRTVLRLNRSFIAQSNAQKRRKALPALPDPKPLEWPVMPRTLEEYLALRAKHEQRRYLLGWLGRQLGKPAPAGPWSFSMEDLQFLGSRRPGKP